MLIKCPECQKEISETVRSCPHCGYQLTEEKVAEIKKHKDESIKKRKKRFDLYLGISCLVIIGAFVIGAIIGSLPSKKHVHNEKPSSYYLESLVKSMMHNPDSYEQVNTEYSYQDGYNVIKLTYRGTNAFGGIVSNWITAKVNSEGEVVQVIQQGP